ncbi:Galactokinase [bioreactor metagenome]|jgi:galactokinase|uniref:Galactokinase n=1 Tax=bioreactor metagenome TaxID=1076179 RepID=A0A644UQ60_9ZZZZ|nr:galactokinase [Lentimicrobium sp.]MEA5109512.1 galactokinase [Lentimicrobium sp.]
METEFLKAMFSEKYGPGPVQGFFAPGRVNLIGEHTDYNGGFVLPCALSFGNYCLIRKTDRPYVRFSSLNMKFETELSVEDLNKPVGREWVNYPVGVFAQFLKRGVRFPQGADLLFYGDVPAGAGLSSSAAIEVVTAVAINNVYETGYSEIDLVKMAQKAEHEFAGVMCGIMDQFASAMGKEGHAVYLNCDTLEYELVPLTLEGVKIVIANTNSPHKLDSGKYNERVGECHAAVAAIQPYKPINQLADITVEEFSRLSVHIQDSTVMRRARHVVTEIERTRAAVEFLKAGDIQAFGKLMIASHNSLRDDYEVTGPELDAMVESSLGIEGVLGSRMTGGGFGGCTVSLVKDEAIEGFISRTGAEYRERTGLTPAFYVAETSDGGKRIC